jgi:hypothetical protein
MNESRYPGAVKGSRSVVAAYTAALEQIPDDLAAAIRRYVAGVNEEAGQWRRRYRATQLELEQRKGARRD